MRLTCTQASSEVGRTRQYVSKSLGPHKSVAILLNVLLHFFQTTAESIEDLFHVSSLLHRDDTGVVLLVDPNQKVLVLVVPDATSVGPVASHTSTCQQRWDWFIEQEMIVDQLLLFIVTHTGQWVVSSGQITLERVESWSDNVFHTATFSTCAMGWQRMTFNRAASPNSRAQHILLVELSTCSKLKQRHCLEI